MTSIAEQYQIVVRDQAYDIVAIFDDVISCEYSNELNAVGTFALTLDYDDARADYFVLDGIVQIFRTVPGIGLAWYEEFIGLYRSPKYSVDSSGKKTLVLTGVGLNDFLFRTIINYKEGTVKAYKNNNSETVMKEYVEENCGPTALIVAPYERQYDGALPDFTVDTDTAAGVVWEGDHAFENLLDILVNIANISKIDFTVTWNAIDNFVFYAYPTQLGLDRTSVGVDPLTGLNASGNVPVVFSLLRGNVQDIGYENNRIAEANVVSVLGDGDGATRDVVVLDTVAVADSPWNRREASRAQGGFLSQMQTAGENALNEMSAREVIEFSPMLQPSLMYGKDYMLGDRVTVIFKNVTRHKRITKITNAIGKGNSLAITFADL